MEYFPGFTTMQLCYKVQKFLSKNERRARRFHRTDDHMSMLATSHADLKKKKNKNANKALNSFRFGYDLGQTYLGPVLLRPVLLRPGLLWPILLGPGLLRPDLLSPGLVVCCGVLWCAVCVCVCCVCCVCCCVCGLCASKLKT